MGACGCAMACQPMYIQDGTQMCALAKPSRQQRNRASQHRHRGPRGGGREEEGRPTRKVLSATDAAQCTHAAPSMPYAVFHKSTDTCPT